MFVMEKKLPIGIQSFEKLRNEDCVYIDKTRQIYDMVERGSYYFLSRPRRFGKSLLVSTLHAYFNGKKELFEGLAMSELEKDWVKRPVLHLDLNTQKYDSVEALEYVLNDFLTKAEMIYGKMESEVSLGQRFQGVIQRACENSGHRVAILIDEYDKPMLQAIGNKELQDDFRSTLKGFYGALKSMDKYIKFALLTGVTKFGKVSVFSDLNHLNDISMDLRYAEICGLTEKEIRSNFDEYIMRLAENNSMTKDEAMAELKRMYDGYFFCEETKQGMYNPFSVLNAMDKCKFGSYWFETGTPTYLVQLLQNSEYNLEEMSRVEVTAPILNSTDPQNTNPIPVIYQSGYLTIKDFDKEFNMYALGFPNKEVEEGFMFFLMPFYIHTWEKAESSAFEIRSFVKDVRSGNTDQFVKRLKSLFADTPYLIIKDLENHYQNVLWLVFKLMGFYVQAEYHTSDGRIDLVLKTKDFCYVMEFKLDGTAEEALAQIQDKSYTLPFELDGQKVIRIGMNFSKETRNIEKYIVG